MCIRDSTKSDRGPVPYDFLLDHMLLQLKRSPVMEAELAQYIDCLLYTSRCV